MLHHVALVVEVDDRRDQRLDAVDHHARHHGRGDVLARSCGILGHVRYAVDAHECEHGVDGAFEDGQCHRWQPVEVQPHVPDFGVRLRRRAGNQRDEYHSPADDVDGEDGPLRELQPGGEDRVEPKGEDSESEDDEECLVRSTCCFALSEMGQNVHATSSYHTLDLAVLPDPG